jgi:hypothetical protein
MYGMLSFKGDKKGFKKTLMDYNESALGARSKI